MNLKEFVSEALQEIHNGVADAIRQHTASGGLGGINVVYKKDGKPQFTQSEVKFEVAVTVNDGTSGTGKAGIQIFNVANIGGDLSHKHENTSVNKISFSVPLTLPAQIFED